MSSSVAEGLQSLDLESLVLRCWKLRWPPAKWAAETSRKFTQNCMEGSLCDILFKHALVGRKPSSLVSSYLDQAIASSLISIYDVLDILCAKGDPQKPEQFVFLIELVDRFVFHKQPSFYPLSLATGTMSSETFSRKIHRRHSRSALHFQSDKQEDAGKIINTNPITVMLRLTVLLLRSVVDLSKSKRLREQSVEYERDEGFVELCEKALESSVNLLIRLLNDERTCILIQLAKAETPKMWGSFLKKWKEFQEILPPRQDLEALKRTANYALISECFILKKAMNNLNFPPVRDKQFPDSRMIAWRFESDMSPSVSLLTQSLVTNTDNLAFDRVLNRCRVSLLLESRDGRNRWLYTLIRAAMNALCEIASQPSGFLSSFSKLKTNYYSLLNNRSLIIQKYHLCLLVQIPRIAGSLNDTHTNIKKQARNCLKWLVLSPSLWHRAQAHLSYLPNRNLLSQIGLSFVTNKLLPLSEVSMILGHYWTPEVCKPPPGVSVSESYAWNETIVQKNLQVIRGAMEKIQDTMTNDDEILEDIQQDYLQYFDENFWPLHTRIFIVEVLLDDKLVDKLLLAGSRSEVGIKMVDHYVFGLGDDWIRKSIEASFLVPKLFKVLSNFNKIASVTNFVKGSFSAFDSSFLNLYLISLQGSLESLNSSANEKSPFEIWFLSTNGGDRLDVDDQVLDNHQVLKAMLSNDLPNLITCIRTNGIYETLYKLPRICKQLLLGCVGGHINYTVLIEAFFRLSEVWQSSVLPIAIWLANEAIAGKNFWDVGKWRSEDDKELSLPLAVLWDIVKNIEKDDSNNRPDNQLNTCIVSCLRLKLGERLLYFPEIFIQSQTSSWYINRNEKDIDSLEIFSVRFSESLSEEQPSNDLLAIFDEWVAKYSYVQIGHKVFQKLVGCEYKKQAKFTADSLACLVSRSEELVQTLLTRVLPHYAVNISLISNCESLASFLSQLIALVLSNQKISPKMDDLGKSTHNHHDVILPNGDVIDLKKQSDVTSSSFTSHLVLGGQQNDTSMGALNAILSNPDTSMDIDIQGNPLNNESNNTMDLESQEIEKEWNKDFPSVRFPVANSIELQEALNSMFSLFIHIVETAPLSLSAAFVLAFLGNSAKLPGLLAACRPPIEKFGPFLKRQNRLDLYFSLCDLSNEQQRFDCAEIFM